MEFCFWFGLGLAIGQFTAYLVRRESKQDYEDRLLGRMLRWPVQAMKHIAKVAPPITYRDSAPCPHCGQSMLNQTTTAPRADHSNKIPL